MTTPALEPEISLSGLNLGLRRPVCSPFVPPTQLCDHDGVMHWERAESIMWDPHKTGPQARRRAAPQRAASFRGLHAWPPQPPHDRACTWGVPSRTSRLRVPVCMSAARSACAGRRVLLPLRRVHAR